MKPVTFRPCFQGDLMIRRIGALPSTAKQTDPIGADHILAHSETGHHHVVCSNSADRFIDQMNDFIGYLSVKSDAEVRHLRDHDTHASLMLSPGFYEIRQQREYVAEGFRPAAD